MQAYPYTRTYTHACACACAHTHTQTKDKKNTCLTDKSNLYYQENTREQVISWPKIHFHSHQQQEFSSPYSTECLPWSTWFSENKVKENISIRLMLQRNRFHMSGPYEQSWLNSPSTKVWFYQEPKTKRGNLWKGARLFTGGLPWWPQKVVHKKKREEKGPKWWVGSETGTSHKKNYTASGKKKAEVFLFDSGQTNI